MSLSVGSSSFFLIYKSALLSLLSEHLASSLLHFFLSRAVICISIFCLDLLFKKQLFVLNKLFSTPGKPACLSTLLCFEIKNHMHRNLVRVLNCEMGLGQEKRQAGVLSRSCLLQSVDEFISAFLILRRYVFNV